MTDDAAKQLRKTRFVLISDTHNATPGGAFQLPPGDVLIHAGDLTNQGSFKELQRTVKWIEEADYEIKIVIAGNHDVTIDESFYSKHAWSFHNQGLQNSQACRELLTKSPSILYLEHETAMVSLTKPDGPRTTFKVFGSPYSPEFGLWAFGYRETAAFDLWKQIPLDTDVVITHTPMKYHCDETVTRRAVGCEALRQMMWRVRPRLAVCGHIHEARGAELIKWDLSTPNISYKEDHVQTWQDPGEGNEKVSLIDLTGRGEMRLANDGSRGDELSNVQELIDDSREMNAEDSTVEGLDSEVVHAAPSASTIRGYGGSPPSFRSDLEALSGRLGRKQTCVVNAAILANSWPQRGHGGKRYNKPIVVDIDLPIMEDQ